MVLIRCENINELGSFGKHWAFTWEPMQGLQPVVLYS